MILRSCLLILTALASTGCAFHSTATEWNMRVGGDGEPVFYTATTKAGAKLGIVIPFLGDLGIEGLVDNMSAEIAARGGDRMRIVQGSTENYWYGFPPFTWIVTPVVSTLTAEYRPAREELLEAAMNQIREESESSSEAQVRELAEAKIERWMGEGAVEGGGPE